MGDKNADLSRSWTKIWSWFEQSHPEQWFWRVLKSQEFEFNDYRVVFIYNNDEHFFMRHMFTFCGNFFYAPP